MYVRLNFITLLFRASLAENATPATQMFKIRNMMKFMGALLQHRSVLEIRGRIRFCPPNESPSNEISPLRQTFREEDRLCSISDFAAVTFVLSSLNMNER
jgi:hypothetical protein